MKTNLNVKQFFEADGSGDIAVTFSCSTVLYKFNNLNYIKGDKDSSLQEALKCLPIAIAKLNPIAWVPKSRIDLQ